MKTIVFLYAGNNSFWQFEKAFNSHSAFFETVNSCLKIADCEEINIIADNSIKEKIESEINTITGNITVTYGENWTNALLLKHMAQKTEKASCECAVFSFSSCLFLKLDLIQEIFELHGKYLAEYTYADGYPYGLAPEVIDSGTLRILSSLAEGAVAEEGNKRVSKDSVFSIMKKDINSFEIETLIAPKDFRMLRLDFSCSSKETFTACKKLYEKGGMNLNALELSEMVETSLEIQKTVPSFYNIQISSACNFRNIFSPYTETFFKKYGFYPVVKNKEEAEKFNMSLKDFKNLVKKIKSFSDTATIGLSAFGEPLLHSEFTDFVNAVLEEDGLNVLIETDGQNVSPDVCERIKESGKAFDERINWIVFQDGFTQSKYNEINQIEADSANEFNAAVNAVSVLEKYFSGHVYPQFIRAEENENELEAFYRFYSNKENASEGKLIIQKYNNYCGLLCDRKPADLSPLERNVCWHIKRDMTILCDGSVPLCRERFTEDVIGNAINEPLEEIWKKFDETVKNHLNGKYDEKCRGCDEYYTFNF